MPLVIEESKHEVSTEKVRASFHPYIAWIVAIPMVLYFAAFALVRIPAYERWGGSEWGPILDYAFQEQRQDADVLIFGDSSALFGVDPRQMERELGLKVINLPNTIGSLPVIGDMALKRYLAFNRPPALILFYFCPWDLDYANAQDSRIFEGEEMLVRHGSRKQISEYALHHLREAFYFPFRVYSGLGLSALLRIVHSGKEPEVVQRRGHVDNVLPYDSLPADCKLPEHDLQEHRDASVRRLMATYTTARTGTMLFLAPVPGCTNVAALLSSIQAHFLETAPAVFPAADFNSDTYYAHLKPVAVASATNLASHAIQRYLAAVQPAPADTNSLSLLKEVQRRRFHAQ